MIDKVKAFCFDHTFANEVELPDEFKTKEFFKCFLTFICDNKTIELEKEMKIIEILRNELITLGLKYTDVVDEWAIANVVLYQRMNPSVIISNDLDHFIKFIIFVSIISRNLNQTNQIISNLLTKINNVIHYLFQQNDNIQLLVCYILIELNLKLSIAIKSFNPSLISQFTMLVQSISILNQLSFDNMQTNKYFSFIKETKGGFEIGLKQRIGNSIQVLIDNYRDDINIDILFSNLIPELPSMINNNKAIKALVERIIILYKTYSAQARSKKMFRMNYLVIKPKPLISLEPDYDLSFLGDNPEYLNQTEKKKEIDRIVQKKIKEKEKQIIRKLKHEAKVIDTERQKELDFIDKKKKEDLRITNQFIEQQNAEYKKLVTSNQKKRFKFKKKKKNN